MMRTTVSTQPQIIIVACCITLRRSGYDTAGNIRSITKDGAVTKSFGYTNPSWPDLLTSVTANGTTKDVLYEGQSQTSDLPSSGNPITYYNGKDYTFTWTKGRQLASATVDGKQVSYTYDMSGVRTSKTVNGTTYNYTTLSGKVMRQTWGNKSLEFVYDDGNQPFAMIYNDGSTSTLYYYVLNAQGDVIALLNANGTLAASYNYGAWGNYSVHGADGKKTTDATFIGHINPLRYRGYYYDRETRLYYLQSRYYDFANCRFINADTFATTDANGFLSANMFAYCENNPIMRTDPNGEWAQLVVGAAVGAIVGGISAAVSSYKSTGQVNVGVVLLGAGTGAIGGLIGATGMSMYLQAAISGVLSATNNVGTSYIQGEKVDFADLAIDTAIGSVSSFLGSKMVEKAAVQAGKQITRGIGKIARGIAKRNAGNRYWKGATKRGLQLFSSGVKKMHTAQGRASVIGSSVGGALSIFKSWFF